MAEDPWMKSLIQIQKTVVHDATVSLQAKTSIRKAQTEAGMVSWVA